MRIKILSHWFKIRFVAEIIDEDDDGQIQYLNGRADHDNKIIEIACFSASTVDTIRRRTLPEVYGTLKHEVMHIYDQFTGHELFTDDDNAVDKIKENALDALVEIIIDTELSSKMVSDKWLATFNRARLRPKKPIRHVDKEEI